MSQHEHAHAFPASQAWMLDNPFRRLIQPPSDIVEKLSLIKEQTAVDFGCGPGYFTVELAKHAGKVYAVDLSAEMLKIAQRKTEKAHAANVEFLQSDGKTIQLKNGAVDLILLVTVFHEIGDSVTVLGEFHRILKPTGKLAIVEVIKKGAFAFAPIQNPQTLQGKVEAEGYKLEKIEPYKSYGIFHFNKK